MMLLSVILVNSDLDVKIEKEDIEILRCENDNISDAVKRARGKYVLFICNQDRFADHFFDLVYDKVQEEFDCCFINYYIDYEYKKDVKRNNTYEHTSEIKPYYLEYLWNFMFRRDIFLEILKIPRDGGFDESIDNLIKINTAISDVVYYHRPVGEDNTLADVPYVDVKSVEYYKNIIYLKDNLSGLFNGVITWALHIGKCFGDKYDIVLMYDYVYDETYDRLSKYFTLMHREKFVNYFCDRYICTYLDYDIPNNIFYNEESSTFIHGLMLGDELTPDLYDRYIAVSKTCMETVKFAFEGKECEYIHNPVCINKDEVKPHINLVSTLRSEECKGLKRLEQLSKIFDEEKIPYTWNVFTDVNEGTNHDGFIYRNSVFDALPYVKAADYLVLLSDIESFSYSVVESLMLNTKVVVTPVKVYDEIGVKDGKNAIVIPFEYFEEDRKEDLRKKVLEIYEKKDKRINFKPTKLNFLEFGKLFKE